MIYFYISDFITNINPFIFLSKYNIEVNYSEVSYPERWTRFFWSFSENSAKASSNQIDVANRFV